jgi:hypothetical protein
MCLFITAVVPKAAMTDDLVAVVKEHRLSFKPCDNMHVIAQLRASERYLFATSSYCDCGSALFSAPVHPESDSPQKIAGQIRKLRRKKWSEAKIQDWLKATAPRKPDQSATPSGQRTIEDWAAFLEQALALPTVSYIGLVGHSYSGDVDSERFALSGRVVQRMSDLSEGGVAPLAEDVIHEFRLSPRNDRLVG